MNDYKVEIDFGGEVVFRIQAETDKEALSQARNLFESVQVVIPLKYEEYTFGETNAQVYPWKDVVIDDDFKRDYSTGFDYYLAGEELPPDASDGFATGYLASKTISEKRVAKK